ncbi:septum formation initiator family protein [Corynebacterium sp.]|uniref:FtsB family cell division protein n=1 Tax=Corynebacterium sp. TaxID=1720 RepID=UPI0026DC9967|nr:septum formation initiator family protein [Corynebacterium sp.]MDO5032831.1 septum formation initiator family protein [Corynebacterium sp.]
MASRSRAAGTAHNTKGKNFTGKKGAGRLMQRAGKMDIVGVGVIIAVILIVLLAIAQPLRNYYHVRSETARLESSIAAKQAQKEELLEEIDKYNNDDYLKQQARRRFGVMEEGETAFRIIDPRMKHENTVTTDKLEEHDERPWYEVLWDSVATAPEEDAVEHERPHNLPTQEMDAPPEGEGAGHMIPGEPAPGDNPPAG